MRKPFCLTLCAHFSTSSVIPAVFIGTIDFFHLIPLSMSLALAEGHRISAEQKPSKALHSHTLVNLSDSIPCVVEAVQVLHPDTTFK